MPGFPAGMPGASGFFGNTPLTIEALEAALDELYLKTMSELIQEDRIYEVLAHNIDITKRAYDDFYDIANGLKQPFYNEELAREVKPRLTRVAQGIPTPLAHSRPPVYLAKFTH